MRVLKGCALTGAILSAILSPATAADLGGSCCADLEERIAALEATAARKGNKVVTLTLSGQVNRALLYWRDAGGEDLYAVSDFNQETRFRFLGEGRLNPKLKAGYFIEIGVFDTLSNQVTQANDNGGETALVLRHDLWFLEHTELGRITVGHTEPSSFGTDTVDLAELTVVTSALSYKHSGGLLLRNTASNALLTANWGQAIHGQIDVARADLLRYDSPLLHGFRLSATWGEDDAWDIALRFAGEWNGLRAAAALAYIEDTDENGGFLTPVVNSAALGVGARDIRQWQGSASLWHVPSGVFVSGSYTHRELEGSFDFGIDGQKRPDQEAWWIAAGVRRNWLGIGTTAIYGEYAGATDILTGTCGNAVVVSAAGLSCTSGLIVTEHQGRLWGLGVVQTINSAAAEIYIGYRHQEVDISTAAIPGGPHKRQPISDLDAVLSGIRIRF